mgnify:CR=1 FL=1
MAVAGVAEAVEAAAIDQMGPADLAVVEGLDGLAVGPLIVREKCRQESKGGSKGERRERKGGRWEELTAVVVKAMIRSSNVASSMIP